MKSDSRLSFLSAKNLCASLTLAASAIWADGQGAFDGKPVHPGMTVSPVTALGNFSTMGIDWLSNGNMVLATCSNSYGGGSIPGPNTDAAVWVVSNITGTPSKVKVADQFRQPSGLVVVNDVAYVSDRDAFFKINSLTNPGNTGSNKTKVIQYPQENLDPDNSWDNGYWHQWIFCPMFYNGRFYAPYSGTIVGGGGSDRNQSSSYSGAVLSWAQDGTGGLQRYAGGLRSPNGAGAGPNGMMMFADNQGSWNPSCPFNLIKKDMFYGTHQNSGFTDNWAGLANKAGTLPYQPPVAWMLDGDNNSGNLNTGGAGQSTSQPLYLDHGPYAGDWIVGDVNQQGIARVSLDPVNGGTGVSANYNGSVTYFTSGFGTANVNRLAIHPTQNIIYVGTVGPIGNWPTENQAKPFYQITFNETALQGAFEVLSVKSRANGVEIIFSQPVMASTATAANFALTHFHIVRQDGYGAGNDAITKPTISAVTLSNDNKRVFLNIGNQAGTDRVLVINMPNILAVSGGPLVFNRAWFTHNYQSTVVFNPSTTAIAERSNLDPYLELRVTQTMMGAGRLHVNVNLTGAYTVSLRSLNGARVDERAGSSAAEYDFRPGATGLYILEVRQGGHHTARPVLF